MKRTFKSILSVAAAAMAFTACNVEPVEAPVETVGAHKVSFVASQVDTKTTMSINEGIASFAWEEADCDGFYIYENGVIADDYTADINDDGLIEIMADFKGEGSSPFTYTGFMSLYTLEGAPAVADSQTDNGAYDPVSDILIAKPVESESLDEEIVSFQFKRVVAINQMTIKGLTAGEKLSLVTIDSDKPIAGKYDFVNDTWANADEDTVIEVLTSAVADAQGNAVVYFVSAPVENAQLTITATTAAGKTYSKELAKTITFNEGGVKAFGVTVAEVVNYDYWRVTSQLSDWRGDYLVAYSDAIFMDGSLDGGKSGVGSAQSHVAPGEALSSDKLMVSASWGDQHFITIEAIDDDDLTKGYVLKAQGKTPYFYQTSNSNGMVGTDNKATAANYPTTITYNSIDDIAIALGGPASGVILHYNNASGSTGEMFRFYKDGGQNSVYLYKKMAAPAIVAVSGVELDKNEIEIEVGETETLIATVAPEDATNKSLTWSSDNESVATVENGVVTAVGVGETTITVKTVDGEFTDECVVTVTSSSVSIANTPETAYTASEAKALIEAGKDLDTEVYVKGIVSKIVTAYDSNYGNISFNVSADGATTGDQFQFFRNFKGAENEKWTDEDAKPRVGDFVIGYGTLTKYNSTYEFEAGNYIVSIDRAQYLEASASKTSGILAEGETITITVDTNIDSWSASITGDSTFSLDQNNKTATTIPVIVSENTDVVNGKTATVTITAGDKEVNIELSQLVKTEGGQGGAITVHLDGSGLPSTATTKETSKTQDNITYVLSSGAKYQSSTQATNAFTNKPSILIGKSGAYIYNSTPLGKKITGFKIYANAGASAKVSVSVTFGTQVNPSGTAQYSNTLSTVDCVYDCSESIPENVNYFVYKVTNANNSQVQFEITYEN